MMSSASYSIAREAGDAERLAQLAAQEELALQVVRRRLAIRLVRGNSALRNDVTRRFIERDRDVLGPHALDEIAEKAGEAVQRIDRIAVVIGRARSARSSRRGR